MILFYCSVITDFEIRFDENYTATVNEHKN